MHDIFISYRRSDTAVIAGRLFDRLTQELGPGSVFIDIDGIPAGRDFSQHVQQSLAEVKVVLVLIGPIWAEAKHDRNRLFSLNKRLHDKNDLVRIEVETALAGNATVVPVLVGSAQMPRPEQLPQSIRGLSNLNAVRLDDSIDFGAHTIRLAKQLASILEAQGKVRRLLTVMPFVGNPGEGIFDQNVVYSEIVVPALGKKFRLSRFDEKAANFSALNPGWLEALVSSEIVLFDISVDTSLLAYMIGVRHSSKRRGTMSMCNKSARGQLLLPSLNPLVYSLESPNEIEQSMFALRSHVEACDRVEVDSPLFSYSTRR